MIQRIQSLYLLFAAALVLAFLVVGDVWTGTLAVAFPWLTPVVLVLGGLAALVALVAVFFYKDRAAQRKIVLGAQWLDLGLVLVLAGVLAAWSFGQQTEAEVLPASAYLTLLLPLAAYAFLRLARRGIEKDIALVRSMDRLR